MPIGMETEPGVNLNPETNGELDFQVGGKVKAEAKEKQQKPVRMSEQEFNLYTLHREVMQNATTLRRTALNQLLNPGLDIYYECKYPPYMQIKTRDYKEMFDREGFATRVASIFPEESWQMFPKIKESEDTEETEFEKAWKGIEKQFHLYSLLQRVDILSGIGNFGVMLLGLSDGGENLEMPVEGVNIKTGEVSSPLKLELLYARPFDQNVVKIDKMEENTASPRFGQPSIYDITFNQEQTTSSQRLHSIKVHWTRVLHYADNRMTSEIEGEPRMRSTYNRLLDVRKILSGSGQMFWLGGFPGYGFETQPEVADVELDTESLKEQLEEYMGGMQRYLALQGMTVKSLAPQISSPKEHLMAQIDFICVTLGIPKRIFMGAERGELASTTDQETWHKRVHKRRESYCTPYMIEPMIDRFMAYGILPPVEEYNVVWPDLSTPSEKDKAEVSAKKTEALSKYVSAGIDVLMPPKEYLMMVFGLTEKEADAIEKAASQWVDLTEIEDAKVEQAKRRSEDAKHPPETVLPGQPPIPTKK